MKVYEFYAYKDRLPVPGHEKNFKKGVFQMIGMVKVQILAENEEEANKKVKKMIDRPYYDLFNLYSHEEHELTQDMQIAQLEIQKKLLDLIKH